jgi:hypothetical protein
MCRLEQNGTLDTSFSDNFNGTNVRIIIEDSNNKYVISTSFTINRIEQNGNIDSTFSVGTGFDNIIYSIIQDSNNKYIIGGSFTTYNGSTHYKIIRLNQDGTSNSV